MAFKEKVVGNHARWATHLAKVLTEDQLRVFFGWSRKSQVPARYVHLSGRDVDEAPAGHYGLGREAASASCPRCGLTVQRGLNYCPRCSALLSPAEGARVEELRRKEDELVARVVRELIELAPGLLERVLVESGAAEELGPVSESYRVGPAGEI